MLAWTRQYTWSKLITNKNKQVILISFLLCLIPLPNSLSPLTGIPTTLTQMCFISHFHPVCPHLTGFVSSTKFRFGKAVPTHPCWVRRNTQEPFAMPQVAPWRGRLSAVAIFSQNRAAEEETIHGTSADLPAKGLCPSKGIDTTVPKLIWQQRRTGMQDLFQV